MNALFFRPGFTGCIMRKKSPIVNPIPQGRHPFAMAGEFQPLKKPALRRQGINHFISNIWRARLMARFNRRW